MPLIFKIIFLPLILVIASCTVYDGNYSAAGTYLPTATSPGLIAVELNDNPEYAKDKMAVNCARLGGLDNSSITKSSGRWGFGYYYWSYRCNGLSVKPASLPLVQQTIQPQNQLLAPASSNTDLKAQIGEAKAKCADLGFKANTEAFGKCVLKLSE